MVPLPKTTDACHVLIRAMLVDLVGGDEVAAMVVDHHVERMTFDELAVKYELDRMAIHRRIARARVRLRRLGLMPPEWEGSACRRGAASR